MTVLTDDELHRIRRLQEEEIVESRTQMASWAASLRPTTVLSIGEGNDLYATWLGHTLRTSSVPTMRLGVALDRRQGPGSFHRRADRADRFPTIAPIVADGLRLPFPDGSFDCCVASFMLDDCADPQRLISEMGRSCNTDGLVLLAGHGLDAEPGWSAIHGLLGANHPHQLTVEDIDQLCSQATTATVHAWTGSHAWVRICRPLV